ncbi:MAG TPA: IS3 family transposase [Chitinophagaceae bacterium]|nr:IS3 family transposase [Chitinophagaceae bacterium]
MSRICAMFGVTRQAFYKGQQLSTQRQVREDMVLREVKRIRVSQPRVGTRKLYRALHLNWVRIGRDHLFEILRKNRLLIKPMKNFKKTTNSYHRFRKHRNLIKDLIVTAPNQVFVSDITYLDTLESSCYLFLVTDLYSRKIVGWNVSKDLSVQAGQKALKMALQGVEHPEGLIHHSDRGVQYCSPRYTDILDRHKVRISMTEENHVYENAVAERVNGILKTEFLLGQRLQLFNQAEKLAAQSIKTYNEQRLHMSLNYRTPAECYAV